MIWGKDITTYCLPETSLFHETDSHSSLVRDESSGLEKKSRHVHMFLNCCHFFHRNHNLQSQNMPSGWKGGASKYLSWGSSQIGYVENNHGDRKSPRPGVVGPLPNGLNGPYMVGINHLLTGMILQVLPRKLTYPPQNQWSEDDSCPFKWSLFEGHVDFRGIPSLKLTELSP